MAFELYSGLHFRRKLLASNVDERDLRWASIKPVENFLLHSRKLAAGDRDRPLSGGHI